MSREGKTKPGQLQAARQRHQARQRVVDAAKAARDTGEPQWVTLGGARLKIGPYDDTTFPYENIVFVYKGQVYAAQCAARKGGSDQRPWGELSGAPFPADHPHIAGCKVLATVLEHHPR